VAPAPAYLDIVRRGYAEHGLGTEPLEAAASGAPHAGPINRVFVYGTLRRGEERHAVLVRHGAVEGTKALTAGTLLDLGPYPGLVLDGPVASVTGEVYTTPEPEELFTELDAIETFRGYGAGESVYRRAIVRVRSAELGSALAWTYVYVGSRKESHVMASGDWHDRERS
jgi:gamma-glutamylcyclotransferase (GGCT)/AIG2-like uncharacterized protein YtfP